jgi:hypothetical protein
VDTVAEKLTKNYVGQKLRTTANGPSGKTQRNAVVAETSLEKYVVVESHDVGNA